MMGKRIWMTLMVCVMLTVSAMAAERTVTVERTDGASREAAVSVPGGGALWCAAYNGAGKMLEAFPVDGTRADIGSASYAKLIPVGRDLAPAGPAVRVDPVSEAPEGSLRARRGYSADGILLWRHEIAYDAEGREASVTAYDADGTRTGRVDIRYDSEGRDLTWAGWNSSTGELYRYEYEYAGSGWYILRETEYLQDGSVSWMSQYQYDEEGRQTQYESISYYDGEESWHSRGVYTYDDAGRRIREDEYGIRDGSEELTQYDLFRYDADGRMTQRDEYDPDGTRTGYSAYEYDADGREILEVRYYVRYNGDGTAVETRTGSYARIYDERGRTIRGESRDGDGKLTYYWQNEFDSEGRQIRNANYSGVWLDGSYTGEVYLSHERLYADWRMIRENEYRYDRDSGTNALYSYVLYEYG